MGRHTQTQSKHQKIRNSRMRGRRGSAMMHITGEAMIATFCINIVPKVLTLCWTEFSTVTT